MSYQSTDLQKIVIRMPNWLGDAVMATPTVAMVRKKYKNSKISLLCTDGIAALLQNDPAVDQFITFSNIREKRCSERMRLRSILKQSKFDLGILLTNSLSSAWQFYEAEIPIRLGYKMHFRNLLLTHGVDLPVNDSKQHLVKTYKALLEHIGIHTDDSSPQLYITEDEKHHIQMLLQSYGAFNHKHTLIGINPGAQYGSAKCWPKESFLELTKQLLTFPHTRIIYFADSTGKALVDEICSEFSHSVINLAGKTNVRELITLIKLCNLFISNDSGPMHIAAALKTPLVAIFGSTNEVKTGPYEWGRVIHNHAICSPCYLRSCPIDFRCMKSITPTEVLNAAKNILFQYNTPFNITISHTFKPGHSHGK